MLVYGIYFNGESYVGSTMDFNVRKKRHRNACYNINSPKYNYKLYKTIREHNINWDDIEWFILQEYPEIDNKNDLKKFEDLWMDRIKPTLNSYRAYRNRIQYYQDNKEQISEHKKQYYQNNKEKILEYTKQKIECECGSVVTKWHIARHKKSNKHINFVNT